MYFDTYSLVERAKSGAKIDDLKFLQMSLCLKLNNRSIAGNAVFLYMRMVLSMAVS